MDQWKIDSLKWAIKSRVKEKEKNATKRWSEKKNTVIRKEKEKERVKKKAIKKERDEIKAADRLQFKGN